MPDTSQGDQEAESRETGWISQLGGRENRKIHNRQGVIVLPVSLTSIDIRISNGIIFLCLYFQILYIDIQYKP